MAHREATPYGYGQEGIIEISQNVEQGAEPIFLHSRSREISVEWKENYVSRPPLISPAVSLGVRYGFPRSFVVDGSFRVQLRSWWGSGAPI